MTTAPIKVTTKTFFSSPKIIKTHELIQVDKQHMGIAIARIRSATAASKYAWPPNNIIIIILKRYIPAARGKEINIISFSNIFKFFENSFLL